MNLGIISNIEQEGDRVRFVLKTKKAKQAQTFNRALLEVPTYAIDVVIFNVNFSVMHDETIAMHIGQLVVSTDKITPLLANGQLRLSVNFSGPGRLRARDIHPDIFVYPDTSIIMLREGDQLDLEVIIKEGTGKEHNKWHAVCCLVHKPHEDGYLFSMIPTGAVNIEMLLERAIEIARQEQDTPDSILTTRGSTIFTRSIMEPLDI